MKNKTKETEVVEAVKTNEEKATVTQNSESSFQVTKEQAPAFLRNLKNQEPVRFEEVLKDFEKRFGKISI